MSLIRVLLPWNVWRGNNGAARLTVTATKSKTQTNFSKSQDSNDYPTHCRICSRKQPGLPGLPGGTDGLHALPNQLYRIKKLFRELPRPKQPKNFQTEPCHCACKKKFEQTIKYVLHLANLFGCRRKIVSLTRRAIPLMTSTDHAPDQHQQQRLKPSDLPEGRKEAPAQNTRLPLVSAFKEEDLSGME
jgi:hypothetical protein